MNERKPACFLLEFLTLVTRGCSLSIKSKLRFVFASFYGGNNFCGFIKKRGPIRKEAHADLQKQGGLSAESYIQYERTFVLHFSCNRDAVPGVR